MILNVRNVAHEWKLFSYGNELYIKTHPSGWTISGFIETDYYSWISKFEAAHQIYGKITADLDDKIIVESYEAWIHFLEYHPIELFNEYD